MAKRLLLATCLAISGGHAAALAPPGALTAVDAAAHIGETATVCGVVAGAKYATQVRGEPTFLDIDKPYPRPVFTAVIWGENRAAFGTPEVSLQQKRVCVKGTIESYRGRPEIILRDPKQLVVQ